MQEGTCCYFNIFFKIVLKIFIMDHKSINICENGFKYCALSYFFNLDVTALCIVF